MVKALQPKHATQTVVQVRQSKAETHMPNLIVICPRTFQYNNLTFCFNFFGGPVICNGVVCSGTTPRCDSGTCKCSKTANAFDEGDGTTKGSCSGSNEKCQMSGSCVEDGKQLKYTGNINLRGV